jgi:hypothetical protein
VSIDGDPDARLRCNTAGARRFPHAAAIQLPAALTLLLGTDLVGARERSSVPERKLAMTWSRLGTPIELLCAALAGARSRNFVALRLGLVAARHRRTVAGSQDGKRSRSSSSYHHSNC